MAYITGEFIYNGNDDIKILVLQPTRDEYSFKEGMKTMVEFDSMDEFNVDELKEFGEWIIKTSAEIKSNYKKNGAKKINN